MTIEHVRKPLTEIEKIEKCKRFLEEHDLLEEDRNEALQLIHNTKGSLKILKEYLQYD